MADGAVQQRTLVVARLGGVLLLSEVAEVHEDLQEKGQGVVIAHQRRRKVLWWSSVAKPGEVALMLWTAADRER
jgi:hypothetical protein